MALVASAKREIDFIGVPLFITSLLPEPHFSCRTASKAHPDLPLAPGSNLYRSTK
jgi:hypothetical protein